METSAYIAALAAELERMARDNRLYFLAFLLGMVVVEARRD